MNTKNIITSLTASLLDEVKKVMKNEKEKGESKADEKAEHCSEALKGDQHKIDANKNGKVDAHDFKLLRKKKGVAETYSTMNSDEEIEEEVEDLEELSKGTLNSYLKRSNTDVSNKILHVGKARKNQDSDEVAKLSNKIDKRYDGKFLAKKKLTQEEVEDLEELSKGSLGKYINKAKDSIETTAWRQGHKEGGGNNPSGRFEKRLTKRNKGIETAVKKLTKEEVELTQEEIDRLDAMMADLDEARGRPPKEGSDAWKKRQAEGAAEQDEPRQHPIQQLERIKRDMRGGADFKHKDGSTHHVTGVQASKILSKYHGLKPAEKETMQKEIHGSHAGLKKHL